MVTFTKDPKLYKNLWDANKDHMKGINNFISFIKKRIKAEIKRYPEFKMMNEALKRGHVMDYNSGSSLFRVGNLHPFLTKEVACIKFRNVCC